MHYHLPCPALALKHDQVLISVSLKCTRLLNASIVLVYVLLDYSILRPYPIFGLCYFYFGSFFLFLILFIGFLLIQVPYPARWQRTSLIIYNVLQPRLYLCEMISLLLPHLAPSSALVMSNMLQLTHLSKRHLLCRKLMHDDVRNVISLTLCSLPRSLRLRALEHQAVGIPLRAQESSRGATRTMSYSKKKFVIPTLIQPDSYW